MRQIAINGSPYSFLMSDLPLVIHGVEKSGASLFSVVTAASICKSGNPLFFWSAYPMAKEEFNKEIDFEPSVHRINSADEITGQEPQIIIMMNETPEALDASLSKIDPGRVLFIKNFETLPETLRRELLQRQSLIITGDLVNILTKEEILEFRTQIFFSPYPGIDIPKLEKYDGFILRSGNVKVLF